MDAKMEKVLSDAFKFVESLGYNVWAEYIMKDIIIDGFNFTTRSQEGIQGRTPLLNI